MRLIALLCAWGVVAVVAVPARAQEPTADQIKVAKAAYEKLGGAYSTRMTQDKKTTIHDFFLPQTATDDTLKKLPEVPFPFELHLNSIRVTEKGLKPLTAVKNLRTLALADSLITDGSLQMFRETGTIHIWHRAYSAEFYKRPATDAEVARLDLNSTRVTAKGLKELTELPGLTQIHLNGSQATAESLKGLKSLKNLYLRGALVTDAKLKEIKGLTDLTTLDLSESRITDKGLKEIQGLKKLYNLYLNETFITDAGLKELTGFDGLNYLDLHSTAVTDKGIAELKALKGLKTLDLLSTKVTDKGVKDLKAALPDCRIIK
jgi:internalin A